MVRSGRFLMALAVALSSMACDDSTTGASDVSFVEWKSSFGFCAPASYCTTRLRVSGRQAVLTLESRESPAIRRESQLSEAEADSIAEAAARAEFDALPDVIGCPDCADGGAESLTVMVEDEQDEVTFEYNARVDAVEPLLGRMRALAERLRPAV